MTICILIILVPLVILSYLLEKKISSPMVIFTVLWTIVSFFSSLQLYDFIHVADSIYWMIIIGVTFFFIGCVLIRNYNIVQFMPKERDTRKLDMVMLGLLCIGIIIFISSSVVAIFLLRSGLSISDIYNMRIQMAYGIETPLSATSSLMSILLEYVGRPILAISIPYSAIVLVKDKRVFPILATGIMLVLSFINRGNRLDIMCLGVTTVFAILLVNQRIKLSGKQRKIIILVIITFGLGIYYISSMRGDFDLLETVYSYLCGNVPFQGIKIEQLERNHEYTYFATSLQGILRFINQILNSFQVDQIEMLSLAEIYSNVESPEVITTTGKIYNAFVGPFYFFYCDGGWIGIMIYSFFNGCISEYIYQQAYRSKDIIVWIFYLIILVRGVCFSFYNYFLVSIMYGMAIIMLIIIGKVTILKKK